MTPRPTDDEVLRELAATEVARAHVRRQHAGMVHELVSAGEVRAVESTLLGEVLVTRVDDRVVATGYVARIERRNDRTVLHLGRGLDPSWSALVTGPDVEDVKVGARVSIVGVEIAGRHVSDDVAIGSPIDDSPVDVWGP